ncbi:MAG TPA: hypothetical protein VGM68_01110 [Rhizomicrobium sp.]
MTRHTILFSFLAVSLAILSLSMAPREIPAPSTASVALAPGHALTGVSFRTISVGY